MLKNVSFLYIEHWNMLLQSFISYDALLSLAKYTFNRTYKQILQDTDCTRVNCDVYSKISGIEEEAISSPLSKNCERVAMRFTTYFLASFYVFSLFASLSIFIFYGLYFHGIDDVDDEHIGDFDVFSPKHSQYLAFFFDDDGLGGLEDKGIPFAQSIFGIYIYSFTWSNAVLTLVTEVYD